MFELGVTRDSDDIVAELVQLVRERIGVVASFKKAVVVSRLPKTRSGKILRSTIKKIAEGSDFSVPATIDDASALDGIAAELQSIGYPQRPREKAAVP